MSVSLTAGDWDVSGVVNFQFSNTSATQLISGISTTGDTLQTNGGEGYLGAVFATVSTVQALPVTRIRMSLASTTTVYVATNHA
jgi:hypothetical protein